MQTHDSPFADRVMKHLHKILDVELLRLVSPTPLPTTAMSSDAEKAGDSSHSNAETHFRNCVTVRDAASKEKVESWCLQY